MSEDLLHNLCDTACIRAWEDEGWGPVHKKLLTMCINLEFPGTGKKKAMTNHTLVLNHMKATGSISIREAMDDYGLSGGHLTKIISDLKRSVTEDNYIMRKFNKHPITGRRYARYHLVG